MFFMVCTIYSNTFCTIYVFSIRCWKDVHPILCALCSKLCTVHPVLYDLYYAFCILYNIFYSLHPTIYTLYLTYVLFILRCKLYIQYFILYTMFSALCTLSFIIYTIHSILHTMYFHVYGLCSTLCAIYLVYVPSTLWTLHSILYTLWNILYTIPSTLWRRVPHYSPVAVPGKKGDKPIQIAMTTNGGTTHMVSCGGGGTAIDSVFFFSRYSIAMTQQACGRRLPTNSPILTAWPTVSNSSTRARFAGCSSAKPRRACKLPLSNALSPAWNALLFFLGAPGAS